LTEASSGLIRFLDVQIDGTARHVLVPVGHARLELVLGQRRIRLRAAGIQDLENVPAYGGEVASAELARTVATAHSRLFRGARYYAHPAYDHRGLYAGVHPIVRAEDAPAGELALQRLTESGDFRLAEGEADIRGWPLLPADAPCGRIRDLIIDGAQEQVRYVELELEDSSARLLPIGYLELDRERRQVLAPGLAAADIEALPAFAGLPLTRALELALLTELERALDARNPFLRVDFSGREIVA
jgi:hypothetical protein